MAIPITPVRPGDVVKLKKGHPCGANEWLVHRVGMDVLLECAGCGRKVRLVRFDFDRRFRGFVGRRDGADRAAENGADRAADGGTGGAGGAQPPDLSGGPDPL